MNSSDMSPSFGQLLRDFFTKYLSAQLGASPRTLESYRDAFRLFFIHCEGALGRQPVDLELSDLDAPIVIGFLVFPPL